MWIDGMTLHGVNEVFADAGVEPASTLTKEAVAEALRLSKELFARRYAREAVLHMQAGKKCPNYLTTMRSCTCELCSKVRRWEIDPPRVE